MGLGIGGEVVKTLNEIKKIERDGNNILTKKENLKLWLNCGCNDVSVARIDCFVDIIGKLLFSYGFYNFVTILV